MPSQSYFNKKYYLTCAAMPNSTTYTLSGACNGTSLIDGSQCTMACNSPNKLVSGSSRLLLLRVFAGRV